MFIVKDWRCWKLKARMWGSSTRRFSFYIILTSTAIMVMCGHYGDVQVTCFKRDSPFFFNGFSWFINDELYHNSWFFVALCPLAFSNFIPKLGIVSFFFLSLHFTAGMRVWSLCHFKWIHRVMNRSVFRTYTSQLTELMLLNDCLMFPNWV